MNAKDLGETTAYGMAIEGGYSGTNDEWYTRFIEEVSRPVNVPYETMSNKPQINGVTVFGDKALSDYVTERHGGSYFRITGNAGDEVTINDEYRGTLDDTGKGLFGGVIEVGSTTVTIGTVTKVINTPYYGLYRVSA